MPSSNPSRASTVKVFSATVVAVATVAGFVAYFNGDTYTNGTQEATTVSGATVTAGGGTQTFNANGARFSTLEATTVSGATVKNTDGSFTCDVNGNCRATTFEATTISGATVKTTAGKVSATDAGGLVANGGVGLSGSTLTLNFAAAGLGNVLCVKTTGLIGYMVRTATGTLLATCN